MGRNVVALLRAREHDDEEVHCLSRFPRGDDSINWHKVDLLDGDAVTSLLRRLSPHRLLHLAWYAEHTSYWDSPLNLAWVSATLHLLAEFARFGGRRAVGVGSCAEYRPGRASISEEEAVAPVGVYGAAKAATALCFGAASPILGLSHAWARLFFPYGPGDQPSRLVPSVFRALVCGEEVEVTDGLQVRDPMFVADVAEALMAILTSEVQGPINVASGVGISIRELAEMMGRLAKRPELVSVGSRPSTPRDEASWVASVVRLREEVLWAPTTSLDEGLRRTLQDTRSALRGSSERPESGV